MKTNTEKVSFGGKIEEQVKGRIDELIDATGLKMGFVIERMASHLAEMQPEELIRFCSGKKKGDQQGVSAGKSKT